MTGAVPFAIVAGNGAGAPGAYLVVGITLLVSTSSADVKALVVRQHDASQAARPSGHRTSATRRRRRVSGTFGCTGGGNPTTAAT